jgi:3-oxoacyl-[acyl-carrier protein] reductase
MRLSGKVALVTGAGRSIGRAIALRLASEGARVGVADLNAENAQSVSGEIVAAGGLAKALGVDVSIPIEVESMVRAAIEQFGRLDILVNNAGIGLTKLFLDTTLEEWGAMLRVNLTGVFLCCQAAARVMVRQRSGRIINIASLSGQRGGTGRAAYGASKAGVTLLTKQLAVELAPYGITVNEVVPGPVDTEMTKITHDDATRHAYYDRIPMRRYASQGEIAAAVAFLVSEDADFINGHSLNVDGGYNAAGLMFDIPSIRTS